MGISQPGRPLPPRGERTLSPFDLDSFDFTPVIESANKLLDFYEKNQELLRLDQAMWRFHVLAARRPLRDCLPNGTDGYIGSGHLTQAVLLLQEVVTRTIQPGQGENLRTAIDILTSNPQHRGSPPKEPSPKKPPPTRKTIPQGRRSKPLMLMHAGRLMTRLNEKTYKRPDVAVKTLMANHAIAYEQTDDPKYYVFDIHDFPAKDRLKVSPD